MTEPRGTARPLAFALVLICWLVAVPASAQAARFRIAFSLFSSSGLPAGQTSVTAMIPLSLRSKLRAVAFRKLSEAEIAARANAAFEKELFAVGKAHSKAVRDSSLLALFPLEPDRLAARRIKFEQDVADGAAKLAAMRRPEGAIVADIPVEYLPADGGLARVVESDPSAVAKDYDALVYGSISWNAGYYVITVKVYSTALGSVLWNHVAFAAADDTETAIESVALRLGPVIAGTPFACVTVSTVPSGATVFVDGRPLSGSGTFVDDVGGEREIVASYPGYEDAAIRVETEFGSEIRVTLYLVPVPSGSVIVESLPAGASVWIDSLPAGGTPLLVSKSDSSRAVRAEAPGFQPLDAVIPAGYSGYFPLDLVPEGVERLSFDDAKDRFYESLGWFVLSLPATVLSYGLFAGFGDAVLGVQDAFLSGLITESQRDAAIGRHLVGYYGFQTVFWISASASVVFLGYAIYEFVLYLDAAD